MSERPDIELATTGPAAPPRTNGELAFDAPWQGRSFAVAVLLAEAGAFSWDDFQSELIQSIQAWERRAPKGATYRYWDRWQETLERLVARGTLSSWELSQHAEAVCARPHGWDHAHD